MAHVKIWAIARLPVHAGMDIMVLNVNTKLLHPQQPQPHHAQPPPQQLHAIHAHTQTVDITVIVSH